MGGGGGGVYGPKNISPHLYLYIDDGWDRKINNFKVLFSASGSGGSCCWKTSCRLFLQKPCKKGGFALPLLVLSVKFERAMKKCDSNMDTRKECEHNQPFKSKFIESIRAPKESREDMLLNMSLKGYHSPFSNRLHKMISVP